MSIEDFENQLKSKLVTDFKATGLKKMYVDIKYWRAVLSEEGYNELMKNAAVDYAANAPHDYYHRVIDIAKMDAMTKRHNIAWHIVERRAPHKRPDWAELCIIGVIGI